MLTDDDHVELEAALEQLFLDLTSDAVKADIGGSTDLLRGWGSHF